MKISAVLLFAAVICYAEARECSLKVLGDVVKKCITDTKASEIDFLEMIALKPARNDQAKCFRFCIIKDCEYVDNSGQISAAFSKDTGLLLGGADKEKVTTIENAAASCVKSTKNQDDLCVYTENLFNCIVTTCKSCGISVPNILA